MNDVLINKIKSIHRCIERVEEEYKAAGNNFHKDYTRQDAAILNIMRACEQSIDIANHIIKTRKLGIPSDSSESFDLLAQRAIISDNLSENLKKMIHFRNIVVHQYQKVNIDIVKSVIEKNLKDLLIFTENIMDYTNIMLNQ